MHGIVGWRHWNPSVSHHFHARNGRDFSVEGQGARTTRSLPEYGDQGIRKITVLPAGDLQGLIDGTLLLDTKNRGGQQSRQGLPAPHQ